MIRLERVLCPVDFSPASEIALTYAIGIARIHSATLELVHVVSPLATVAYPQNLASTGNTPRESQELAWTRLKQLEARVRAAGVRETASIRRGGVYKTLRSTIDSIHPDVVIMGTHGRSGLERLLFGSVTEEAVRRSRVPVLAVPPVSEQTLAAPPEIRRILVATDLSEWTRGIIDHAVLLTDETDVEVRLLHVVPRPDQAKEALSALTTLLNGYRNGAVPGVDRVRFVPEVEIGAPHEGILDVAARTRSSVVVMSAHTRGRLERAFLPATVERVLRTADRPVFAVPDGRLRPSGV